MTTQGLLDKKVFSGTEQISQDPFKKSNYLSRLFFHWAFQILQVKVTKNRLQINPN